MGQRLASQYVTVFYAHAKTAGPVVATGAGVLRVTMIRSALARRRYLRAWPCIGPPALRMRAAARVERANYDREPGSRAQGRAR